MNLSVVRAEAVLPVGPEWRSRRLCHPLTAKKFDAMESKLDLMIIDLETGGQRPEDHPILAVGFIVLVGGRIVDAWESGVLPHEKCCVPEPEALKINGWTGMKPDDISEDRLLAVLAAASRWVVKGQMMAPCGHNVAFDHAFLRAASQRNTAAPRWPPRWLDRRDVDTCALLYPLLLNGTIGSSRSLDNACKHLKLWDRLEREKDGHKSPLADCIATLAVLYEILWRFA